MSNLVKFWDLRKPYMARDFIKQVRIGEEQNKVAFFERPNGEIVAIDDASDAEILEIAAIVASMIQEESHACN